MSDPVVIFRTASQIEANVVKGLLEANGIPAILLTHLTRSVFPLAISGEGELRIAVSAEQVQEAREVIDSHREEVGAGRVVRIRDEFGGLERRIEYRFRDPGLLEHALTHRSSVHEDVSGGVFDNESLEFLGDAVLGFVVADMLFREFPQHNEGQKSKIKAWLVSEPSLAQIATDLGLGEFLILGRGEEKSGGRRKQALVADSFEALIAAIYLDGGIEAAREFIGRRFRPLMEEARRTPDEATYTSDYKSALQERLQAQERGLPEYRLIGEFGPAHRKRFEVEVLVDGGAVARGEGRSKKRAEQEAARAAIEQLALDPPAPQEAEAPREHEGPEDDDEPDDR
ncbi:MAG TPA: ribonuclease III [Vicinamibacterales bacterium]|nr:ribonuclease III [Vicinamibacterales bacterium]